VTLPLNPRSTPRTRRRKSVRCTKAVPPRERHECGGGINAAPVIRAFGGVAIAVHPAGGLTRQAFN
jgi:hypothetical protein